MPFQIIRNDITKVTADAIVNTANPKPVIGSGTDSAIYAAAGEEKLLAQRKIIGTIRPGQAVHTDAFNLHARYIIHTVGPVWVDGQHGESEILRSCYENSLALADKLGCTSVAFPLISSGVYGFPKDEALSVACSAIGKFVMTHEMMVTLVVLDRKELHMSENLMGKIQQYIDDHGAQGIREAEYGNDSLSVIRGRIHSSRELEFIQANHNLSTKQHSMTELSEQSLNAAVKSEKSFKERLFELIKERELDDITVYKKANLERKLFSSIKCKKDYKPKKSTAFALGIALELDRPTLSDLLARAGYAIDPTKRLDLIIAYFVDHQMYDMMTINKTLFEFGEETLGYKPQEN